jgi:hypothetical protein
MLRSKLLPTFRAFFTCKTVNHVRCDSAGSDGVHPDALIRKFESGRFRDTFNGVLGGDVDSRSRHGDVAENAGCVDDRTSTRLEHRRNFIFLAEKNAQHVDIENPSVVLLREFSDRPG